MDNLIFLMYIIPFTIWSIIFISAYLMNKKDEDTIILLWVGIIPALNLALLMIMPVYAIREAQKRKQKEKIKNILYQITHTKSK